MSILNKHQILGAKDSKTAIVDTPEWGGEVMVKVFSGKVRDEIEAWLLHAKDTKDAKGFRSLIVRQAACDDQGQLLFDESDVEALESKNCDVLDRVFNAALQLNGLSRGSEAEAVKTFPVK